MLGSDLSLSSVFHLEIGILLCNIIHAPCNTKPIRYKHRLINSYCLFKALRLLPESHTAPEGHRCHCMASDLTKSHHSWELVHLSWELRGLPLSDEMTTKNYEIYKEG